MCSTPQTGTAMPFEATSAVSQKSLRIVYAFDRVLPTTGADAEQALSTVAALTRRGHQVRFILPSVAGRAALSADALRERYRVTGDFTAEYLPTPVSSLLVRKPLHAFRVARLSSLADADVVYTRNSLTMLACVKQGHPTVYDTYRAWPDHLPFLRPVFRYAMRKSSFVGAIFHSAYARQSYVRLGVAQEKTTVIHNGYDPGRYVGLLDRNEAREALGLPRDRSIVTYSGRIGVSKGTLAILKMARQCPEVLFLLVGSTKRGLGERRAARLANVNVIPWQPFERSALYQRASDVLLIPPSSAPLRIAGSTVLPMKVFGYLAAGRPILAPASADLRDVLDEHNAVLIDPDKPEMAVPTLRALLADPARMEAVAQGAKQTAESLTWDCRAAKIEAFLRERLASHRVASTAQPQYPQPESVR